MAIITAREFNQDVSAAKRAAGRAPVVITDRGRPSHVLLSIETYEQLWAAGGTSSTC
ncbi:type II toxin-antitoxin system Phd/YefM family antitoxin [Klenkia sp. LSe6-5]|uniref:Antitoxin n=1 Tax=Klenkia sesuvii TaxID=3103137 RepID=A0ABU8DUI7_9ACTN